MIIVFKQNATVEEKTKLKNQLESKGFQIHASDGVNASLFGVVGDTSALDINLLRVVEGVENACAGAFQTCQPHVPSRGQHC